MIDKKEAYKILGLADNASRNDIERRYAIILKKYRMESAEGQDGSEAVDIDKITGAYSLLMGYVEPQPEVELKAPNPLLKKLGIDGKKAGNFFHYHKIHIIVGIIALIVLAATIRGCVTRVDPDFNIAFMGQLYFNETDVLKETIKKEIPEIKEPGFDGAFLSKDSTDGQQEYAMQMKAMVLFAAGDIDLFILDKESFDRFVQQGVFTNLDEIAPRLGIENEISKLYKMKLEDNTTEHIYGIDISNSEALKKSKIQGVKMIAAISVRSKWPEKAEKVIKLLLK
ncbi:MAG: hypothetical protein FIA99_11330 [Ruminiclostridium sp.]|nr:hypothetical protein [Ruminiclostridium sp.]